MKPIPERSDRDRDPREVVWSRVQRCLDEGRDPFDDEETRQALAADPDLLEEVASLRDTLRKVRQGHETAATRPVLRKRSLVFPALAGCALLVAAALVAFTDRSEKPSRESETVVSPARPAKDEGFAILHYEMRLVRRTPDETTEVRVRPSDRTRTRTVHGTSIQGATTWLVFEQVEPRLVAATSLEENPR